MTLVVIAGPTGSGKTALALRLAPILGGEIVNFDSMQIYEGFDLGTAKPSADDRRAVPHHLFDIVTAEHDFNAADYAARAAAVCREIEQRTHTPLLTGGTFFYLRALLAGLPAMPAREEAIRARLRRLARSSRGSSRLHRWLSRVDPVSASRIPPPDRHRIERALEVWIVSGRPISSWPRPERDDPETLPSIKIALRVDRNVLIERLDRRVEQMYRTGLVDETALLLARYPRAARPFGAIGYREAVAVIDGRMAAEDAIAETKRRTRAYAKRQMTWLRSERNMHWIDAAQPEETFTAALRLLREARR